MSNYISFHNHDTMSILDSCLKTKDLVKWAKANNMTSVGVTNHGTMSSHISLYKECIKEDIKPILGIEFYITENQLDSEGKKIRDNYHLIVLAKNITGWHNMIKLHNLSYSNKRFFYDPRITLEDLIEHKDGLIITSACIGGVIGRPWMEDNIDEAIRVTNLLQTEFGEDFYLELQNHNSEDLKEREKQHNYNKFLIKLSKEYGIKCIVQNDSHYYLQEHWEAHQVLLCKNTGSKLSNPKFTFDSKEYYLKNEAEMLDVFDNYPLNFIEECFKNTSEIASKIEEFDITNKTYDCPVFGEPEEVYNKLHNLAYQGLYSKFTKEFLQKNPNYIERLQNELDTIKKVGYVDYFLMLDDLFKFTNSKNIYTGIGRGSCCGSLVLYCMGITEVEPIKYNLLFSRFINPSRVSMADSDIDVAHQDRDIVVKYLKQRYGEDHVCNIGTYGELTAKASFKAVASVLEIPFERANNLSKLLDSNLSLEENYEQIDTFRSACQTDNLINKAYKIALTLEGTYAQIGTHACGMVISSKPLNDVCPCQTVKDTKTKSRLISTAFEMKEIDGDLKLLKLDVLGLKTLSIIKEADNLILKRHGVHLDYKNLDINNKTTYKMLSEGHTAGIFQFESPLMQRIIRQVQPVNIEDLSCITALARPGALDSGLTEQYIRRRKGEEEVSPLVEKASEYMQDTLQLPIYQENVMQISRVMAGFTEAEADTLRKYIGKKIPDKLKAEREHFINGALNNGYTEDFANKIFDIFEHYGSYGFNKSHSVGYSLLSYATAYYKANYPVEFLTALLNSVTDDLDKTNMYIGEALRLGILVLPPDINESGEYFTINEEGNIRFGLSAIKGLGKSAVNNIISSRKNKPFKSFTDFIERTTKVDKSNLQSLLRVGAFNNLEKNPKRWDMMAEHITPAKATNYYIETGNLEESIYKLVGYKNGRKSDEYLELAELKRKLGGSKYDISLKEKYTQRQAELLEIHKENIEKNFLKYTKYQNSECIQNEIELLGFNITTNPYIKWNKIEPFFIKETSLPYVKFNTLIENGSEYLDVYKLHTVALLSDIKEIKTKKGDRMAKLTVEHCGARSTITVFPAQWENNLEFKIQKGNLLHIVCKLVEANKQYSSDDYEIKFYSIRQLNILVNPNNKIFVNVDKHPMDKAEKVIKKISNEEREQFLPIEKVVMFEIDKKYSITSVFCWVNNENRVAKELPFY